MSISGTIKSNEVLKVITRVDIVPLSNAVSVCAAGDSVLAGGYSGSSAYPRLAYLAGEYRLIGNFAVGGKTSAQILAEQIPQVIAAKPSYCLLQFGTNDISQGVSASTTLANAVSMWTALRAAGIEPIQISMQPVDSAGNYAKACAFDVWFRIYTRIHGIRYVDIMPSLSAGGTGSYKSGLGFDSVHPSSAGSYVMAQKISEIMGAPYMTGPFLAETDERLFSSTPNFVGAVENTVSYLDTNSDGVPDGFIAAGTGGTYSIQNADADGFGKWFRIAMTSGTSVGTNITARTLSSLGWNVGDTLVIGYRVRWVDSNQSLSLTANFTGISAASGSSLFPMFNELAGTETGDDMYVYHQCVIGSGTTVGFQWLATGTGYFEINRPIIMNLTQIGLA